MIAIARKTNEMDCDYLLWLVGQARVDNAWEGVGPGDDRTVFHGVIEDHLKMGGTLVGDFSPLEKFGIKTNEVEALKKQYTQQESLADASLPKVS